MPSPVHSYAFHVVLRRNLPEWIAAIYGLVAVGLAVIVSDPEVGELLFRGYFVQDADEVIRSWYGRCAYKNPLIIPYSHLSMPGWTLILTLGEGLGSLLGLPLTLPGRVMTAGCAWLCLHQGAQFIRAMGGNTAMALVYVILLGASPAFLLMAVTVYPSMALAALTISAVRYRADNRHTLAAAVVAFAPLFRWEGILLIGLFFTFTVLEKRWKTLPALLAPYVIYLTTNALQFGNPWKPLAYRTTRAMGAWLPFNPYLSWEQFQPGATNLITLYSPVVLVGLLPVAAWMAWKQRERLGILALAYGGLTVALLSIQHEFIVYALRVFLTPYTLAVLFGVAAISMWRFRVQTSLLVIGAAAITTSAAMSFHKINESTVPPPGGFRSEAGFHLAVRYADATPVLEWLQAQPAVDYILTNHMNANLLRADDTCQLYDLPLHLGSPSINLDRGFKPLFKRPAGHGLLVFGTLPMGVDDCELAYTHPESRMTVYECDTPK